jgi:Xaa-Pro aminopeptidase
VAVLSSIANTTYVTGIEVPIPLGAGFEMTYAPWLAIVANDGAGLVAPTGAGAAAAANGYELFGFDGFDSFNPTDPAGTYASQLVAAIKQVGVTAGTIGVEMRSLPLAAARAIERAFPNATIVDVEPALIEARQIKTPREIALLRRASHIADVAHTTLAELCREAGRTEFEMFAEISRQTFAAAGRDIPLTGELVTGPRTNVVAYPGGPRERTTVAGDAALMDLSGRVDGYWFDCTNTHVIGAEPDRSSVASPARAKPPAKRAWRRSSRARWPGMRRSRRPRRSPPSACPPRTTPATRSA